MVHFCEWFCIVHRTYFSRRERERERAREMESETLGFGKTYASRHRYHTKDAIHSIQRCVNGIFVCCFLPSAKNNYCRVERNKKKIKIRDGGRKKSHYEIRDFFNTLMRIYLAFGFCVCWGFFASLLAGGVHKI